MTHIGSPRATMWKTLSCVVHSQLLFVAPVRQSATQNKKTCQKLKKIQKQMALRVTSSFRAVTEAVGVIAGIPHINMQIISRSEKYSGTIKSIAHENLMGEWQERWKNGVYGRWTFKLIPKYTTLDHAHAPLSGHGCFHKKNLFDRRWCETSAWSYCEEETEDSAPTFFVCSRWNDLRKTFEVTTNRELLESESGSNTAYDVVR